MFFHKNKRKSAFCTKRTAFCVLFLFFVFSVSSIVSLLLNANAQLVPVKSVEIFSEHSNFENNEPGSWKVTKSAEWTDIGKARITFEVDSRAINGENKGYDSFIITDYIDTQYWTIDENFFATASIGDIVTDITDQKVVWNLGEHYRSGQTASLAIDIILNSEYLSLQDLFLPTNTHEIIESFSSDTIAENIDSNLTPVLLDSYTATYIANQPSDCTIVGTIPSAQKYVATTAVEISDTILTCDGYIFKGWSLLDDGRYLINDDYFRMPSNDVKIYAVWGKPDISKTMDGVVHTFTQYTCVKRYALQEADGTYPDYIVEDTELLEPGETCSYSKSVEDYQTRSASGVMAEDGLTLDLQLPRNTYTLTINRNRLYIGSVSGGGSHRWGESVNISATAAAGGAFTEWSQTAGTESTFDNVSSASTTFVMPKSNATIYADGEEHIVYMQDFTISQCKAECTSGDCYLFDRRDNSDYTVRYINNNCWMTQNLHITGTVSSTDSNFTSGSINLSQYSMSNTTYCTGSGTSSSSPKGYSNICSTYSSGNSNTGSKPTAWYNYAAATAGTITGYSNTTTATKDICPSGWKMPSYSQLSNVRSYSEFNPVVGGWYSDGSLKDRSTIGFWWSTESINSTMRRRLTYNKPAFVTDYRQRSDGGYIRCIMK